MVLCVDYVTIAVKSKDDIELLMQSLGIGTSTRTKAKDKNLQSFTFTDDGDATSFLGVEIDTMAESKHLKQPHLTRRKLTTIGLNNNVEDASINFGRNNRDTPAAKPLLIKDLSGTPRKQSWNHRSVIGMLTCLTGSARPHLAMAVH